MDRRLLAAGLALFAIAGAVLWIPWFTEKRTIIASTPVPPPLFGITPATLKPGIESCLGEVTLAPNAEIGEIGVQTGGKPGPPLRIRLEAKGGFRYETDVKGGYRDTQALHFPVSPPRHALIGNVCVRNIGKRPVNLIATNEFRTMGRPTLQINGTPAPYDAHLAFYESAQRSFAERLGDIFSHAAVFTPPLLAPFVIGLIALLALFGIPFGVMAALAFAAREDEDEDKDEDGA